MLVRLQLITILIIIPNIAGSVELPVPLERYDLARNIRYIEDSSHKLTIRDVRQLTDWKHSKQAVFNQGYNDSSWWLKVSIDNTQSNSNEYYLEIAYAVIDYIEVFFVQNDKLEQHIETGDKAPFQNRLIQHRFFIIPVNLREHESLDLYLKIKTSGSVQVPLVLWDKEQFLTHESRTTILNGLFFGTMIIMFLYNGLICIILRSKTYLFYIGYVISMVIMLAGMGGYSFQYLWPNGTQWNDQSILVALSCIAIFGILFSQNFLQIQNYTRLANTLSNVLIVCALSIFLLSFLVPYAQLIREMVVLAIVSCIFMFITAIYCYLKGATAAKYYIAAWSFMLVGCTVLALNKLGILPSVLLTEYAAHIGSSIEVMMLSFALAEKINREKRLRILAQEQALSIQNKYNAKLESTVAARTQELEALNSQLLQLSTTDSLTGLKNRRYLDQYLNEELARLARSQRPMAVLLLDIDHFKQFNDSHGHLAGDECLKRVALSLESCIRWPSDRATRYGGEEFCIVLPETHAEDAQNVAERIRNKIETQKIEWEGKAISITVSIGVQIAGQDFQGSPTNLLSLADQALYASKQNGRNQVTLSSVTC